MTNKILIGSRSPFTRKGYNGKSYGEIPMPDTDISYVSSGRPSIDRMFPSFYDNLDIGDTPSRMSYSSEIDMNQSFDNMQPGRNSLDIGSPTDFSTISEEGDRLSNASQSMVRTCS